MRSLLTKAGRAQLTDDNAIMNFLLSYAGKFDMYVEDECAAYVRYCFADPMEAAIFRSRFEPKAERLKTLAHRSWLLWSAKRKAKSSLRSTVSRLR